MILVLAALLLAGDGAVDVERAAWRFRREVKARPHEPLATLLLPPELSAKGGPSGRDLRLVDGAGREVPYLLDWTTEREGLATWRAAVKEVRREREASGEVAATRSQWTIDLGEPRRFTDLDVRVPDVEFAWHVRVEASVDGRVYTVVENAAPLFDQTWNGERVRRTTLRFGEPLSARFLRLTARSASDSLPLEIEGASVTLRRRLKGDAWSMDIAAAPVPEAEAPGATTRYRLGASSLLPFDEVEVVTEDPAFSRRARLIEETENRGRKRQTLLGEGLIFRLRVRDAVIAGESVRVPARSGNGGTLYLEVDNASSPPLRGLRVRLHGSRVRLLFPSPGTALTLYYGNEGTRAPVYDLEGLRERLVQALDATPAALGTEEVNPSFKPDPPLHFPAALGASLDASHWRLQRALPKVAEEDVYTLTLRAEDLAVLRSDLADLRVVTDFNRQVPFLIDPDFANERLSLNVGKRSDAAPHRSLFSLEPQTPLAGKPPEVSQIELEVSDAFFDRKARVLHPGNKSEREPDFLLSLSRQPPSTARLLLGIRVPFGEMAIEVDDGDNEALDLRSAVAVVRVPRIVFKAAPGNLRLLLGNRSAEAPRYDITGLRSELLAYSAVSVRADAITENAGARTTLFPSPGSTSRGAVVWTAILAAIVALVVLTLRTLRNA